MPLGEALKRADALVSVVNQAQPLEDREEVADVEVLGCLVSILGNNSRTQTNQLSRIPSLLALRFTQAYASIHDMT